MNIVETLNEMVANYEWAGINSITFGDGKMTLLDIEFYSKDNYYIGPIVDAQLESYLSYNSEDLTPFDVFSACDYKDYKVQVGDGSSEGNGVVFVTNSGDNSIVWFAFFENSEPFAKVSVDNTGVIHALAQNEMIWKIPILNPLKISLHPKE